MTLQRRGALRVSQSKLFDAELHDINDRLQEYNPQKSTLRELDLFVLDNSLRETTVGQLRGHTLDNKLKIYNEVKKVGFKHVIVESFNHMNRIGEPFIRELIDSGEDMSNKYAFTELFDNIGADKIPITDEIPIGLKKCKEFGIRHVVIEMDLVYFDIDYSKFNGGKICDLLSKTFKWIRDNLSQDSRIFVNIRDFSPCMLANPRRLLYIVHYISCLPANERIFGLAYEEGGQNYPEQLAVWTASVRREMNKCGWDKGHLIVHVHEQFGMCNIVQLECLANGATGIWAGLCEEGAAMGHASSCLTIMNLIRMGNKKVLEKFNCIALRSASRAVTEITTGYPPHCKQPVCGDRALDVVFSLEHVTRKMKNDFRLPEFFSEDYNIRISNMASPSMILEKLNVTFGKNEQFTMEIAENMQKQMLADLTMGVKEEYHSRLGLAMLFDKSGGKLNEVMMDVLSKEKPNLAQHQHLIDEVHEIWNQYDIRDGKIDDELDFDAFYDGFMAPHFGCYRCDISRKALQCIDMDKDGKVEWKEFEIFLKWAIRQYPDTKDAYELISIAFNRGIKPAMQDELLKVRGKEEDDEEDEGSDDGEKFYKIVEYEEEDDFLGDAKLKYETIESEDESEEEDKEEEGGSGSSEGFENVVPSNYGLADVRYICDKCKVTKIVAYI